MSSSWVTNGLWWCVISASRLVYFFFDCGYLEIAVDCFVGNIPGRECPTWWGKFSVGPCAKVRSKSKGSLSGSVEWRWFGYSRCHNVIGSSLFHSIEICVILRATLDWSRSSDTRIRVWVCGSTCVHSVKQMNAIVPWVAWYRRWWDKESANVYPRISCKSRIK